MQLFVGDSNMASQSGGARGELKRHLPNPDLPPAKKAIVALNGTVVDHRCFHCERIELLEPCCLCGRSDVEAATIDAM